MTSDYLEDGLLARLLTSDPMFLPLAMTLATTHLHPGKEGWDLRRLTPAQAGPTQWWQPWGFPRSAQRDGVARAQSAGFGPPYSEVASWVLWAGFAGLLAGWRRLLGWRQGEGWLGLLQDPGFPACRLPACSLGAVNISSKIKALLQTTLT